MEKKENMKSGQGSRVFQDRFARTENRDPSNVTAQGPDKKYGYMAPMPPKRK